MNVIINSFNVISEKQIEFTLKFKFNKYDDITIKIQNIVERLQYIQKLDKSLNIYYIDSSLTKIYNFKISTIFYDINSKLNEDNISINFYYDLPDIIIPECGINLSWHVKYLQYAINQNSMIHYLSPFLIHIKEYHNLLGFNHIGELEIDINKY